MPGPPRIRISLLILGLWGLLWMIGLLAGLRSYPHLLGSDALRIRNGAQHDITVPWEAIAQVTTEDRSLPSSMWVLQVEESRDGTHLNVAVSGRVNVHLALREKLAIHTREGELVVMASASGWTIPARWLPGFVVRSSPEPGDGWRRPETALPTRTPARRRSIL